MQQSTLASAGLLQYEIDTPLSELIDKVGAAHAVRAYRAGIEAIDRLESLVGELDDGCDFSRRDTLYLASKRGDVDHLKRESECRQQHGFDVRYLDEAQLAECSSLRAHGAI